MKQLYLKAFKKFQNNVQKTSRNTGIAMLKTLKNGLEKITVTFLKDHKALKKYSRTKNVLKVSPKMELF